jgi:hypothetical protein
MGMAVTWAGPGWSLPLEQVLPGREGIFKRMGRHTEWPSYDDAEMSQVTRDEVVDGTHGIRALASEAGRL